MNNDTISREKLKKHYAWWRETENGRKIADLFDEIVDAQPPAEVTDRKVGKWVPYEFGNKRLHKCSACGIADEYINEKGLEARREFCPHCGAQMDERNGRKERR